MNREEKLKICQLAYQDIKDRMWYWEAYHPEIYFCWDECIGYGEELFHARELEDKQP